MASKFQPDGSPLKQSEGTENPKSQIEEMKALGERIKNVRTLTGRNVVRPLSKQLVTNNGYMVGALNGNTICINSNTIQSQHTCSSALEIQGIEPVGNIKPLIVPSRLKQFDYQPKYIDRSNVLHHKDKFYEVKSHKMKQSRGKPKSRHTDLLLKEKNIKPPCKEMDSLHLNEKTLEKSLPVEHYIPKNTDLVTKDNAADETAQCSNMDCTIGKDEVNTVSNNMHSLSDINVNCTWNSQYIDSPQFTRDKDSYNVMDSGALLVSHEPANVGKTVLISAFSSEGRDNWPTNEHIISNEARPCGFEGSQNNIETDECRSSAYVVITKNGNVNRPVCDPPHTDTDSSSADDVMESTMRKSESQYSRARRLKGIVKPSDDHEREKEQIEYGSACSNVSTNVYVHGICEETSHKSSTRKKFGKPFTCETCKKSFSCAGSLIRHERIHTGQKAYTCDTCENCFAQSNDLERHKGMHTSEKPYKCDACGKCFSRRGRLKSHKRIHTGDKPYSCKTCGRCFAQIHNLKNHARIHTGEKPYACETCGRCFAVKNSLNRHARTHTGEKPYKCDVCGKLFSQKCHLSSHIRIHNGEKPYECDTCEKWFTQASKLERHKRMHTGERPYECDICGKCFSQRCYLSTHIRIHTGEKPYSCKTCGKCFTQKTNLKNHARTHTGEKT